MSIIKFYGSQVGGTTNVPHSYTEAPFILLGQDILSALKFIALAPLVFLPLTPASSGHLCELYPSLANFYDIFLHFVLVLIQVPFLLSIPLWLFLPGWTVLIGFAGFLACNQAVCWLLNGGKIEHWSNPKYTKNVKEHEHECWIFMNGISVGYHWLQGAIDRLALTFGRPVIGVHNKTSGIIFDIIQCLIQRNFNYATLDVRTCYAILKTRLYDPQTTKLVFILHSQGGIEGGMIIDWLLQEMPQDLMAKLEVYTFGCAANHFNNPHAHVVSQHADGEGGSGSLVKKHESPSGKAIRYIEHYAHTSDFVACWGVLYFLRNFSMKPSSPRYMGRVFQRSMSGHMFVQHYLDGMFPLIRKQNSRKGEVAFDGVAEDAAFMEQVVELPGSGDDDENPREGYEVSYFGAKGEPLDEWERNVLLRDESPTLTSSEAARVLKWGELGGGKDAGSGKVNPVGASARFEKGGKRERASNGMKGGKKDQAVQFKVKDLSRLWLYRNGMSPKRDEVDVSIARMGTI